VGDVLIRWDTGVPAAIERSYGLPPGSVLSETLKSEAGRLATSGVIGPDEWFRRVSAALPEAAIKEWLSYHGELNQDLASRLRAVRGQRGVRLYLLTNAMARLWQDLAFHGIASMADEVLCSSAIGLAKPDPRIYQHLVRVAGSRPERILYIEDTPGWADAGRRAGLLAHTYTASDLVAAELERLGAVP
jgi:putative hydrolase of the HAD superfamily